MIKINHSPHYFQALKEIYQNGDTDTKLSFIIMGFANLKNRQFIKGVLFLLAEVIFLITFFYQVIPSIKGLITLGTKEQGVTSKVVDGIKIQVVTAGDSSMLLMLGGIAALLFTAFFGYIYWCNLKSAYHITQLKKQNKVLPNFYQDLKTLLNERFHMTLMSLPILGIMLFTILPLIYMIAIAFTNFDHNHLPPKSLFHWNGFGNFGNVITGRMAGTFFPVLSWTLIWAIFATATNFIFGIVLALIINTRGLKFKKMWRLFFVITVAVPQFISLLIMKNLLSDSGPINGLLHKLGLINANHPLPFLSDPIWAKFSIIVVNMWVGIPITMLVASGIIMNLPQEQIEAAEIDGANRFQIFKSITFPQILLVMTPALIQQFIGNINNFNVIYLLTQGGPSNSNFYQAGTTDLLVTWLYNLTINAADYNIASVIGILIFSFSAFFSLLAYTRSNAYKSGGAK